MFSTSIIEKLAYYIYCLIDPRDGNIFYVGKGVGNRVFHHALGSLQETETPSDKIALIREIHKSGNQPVYYILRHNIQTDKQAFEYEAMAIDLLSLVKPSQQPLTNIQGGTHSSEVGLMSLSELKRKYDAQELKTDKPIVLITINNEYEKLKKTSDQGIFLKPIGIRKFMSAHGNIGKSEVGVKKQNMQLQSIAAGHWQYMKLKDGFLPTILFKVVGCLKASRYQKSPIFIKKSWTS